jgi:S1-C subfamily serine protease
MRIAAPRRVSRPPPLDLQMVDAGARDRRRALAALGFVMAVVLAAVVGGVTAVVVDRSLRSPSEVVVERYGTNSRPVTGGATDVQSLLYAVEPAVVTIDVLKPPEGGDESTGGTARAVESHGTGMLVSSSGRIVTCRHVVAGATSISVTVHGSRTALAATLVAEDPDQDLALLQAKGAAHLPTVTFGDSSKVEVGDDIVVIGNALALSGEPSVTRGMISAVDRDLTVPRDDGSWPPMFRPGLLQTNAPINPGDSGGPFVDSDARVIGMTTLKADTLDGSDAHGVSFATPANAIKRFVERHAG